jgi:hypothetical protein
VGGPDTICPDDRDPRCQLYRGPVLGRPVSVLSGVLDSRHAVLAGLGDGGGRNQPRLQQ